MKKLRKQARKPVQNGGGIELWAMNNNVAHMFTVNVQTVDEAMLVVSKKYPQAKYVSWLKTPPTVINFLKLPLGRAMEWVSMNPKEPLSPRGTPV